MSEDQRISEIRAELASWYPDGPPVPRDVLNRIRAILDRPTSATELGPQHTYALSVARSAVLKAAGRFVKAADMYRRRDLVHSVQQMADEERACVRVASFLAEEIACTERKVSRD